MSVSAGSHGAFGGRVVLGGVAGDLDGQVTLDAMHREGYREHSRQQRASLYANVGWQVSEDLDLRRSARCPAGNA